MTSKPTPKEPHGNHDPTTQPPADQASARQYLLKVSPETRRAAQEAAAPKLSERTRIALAELRARGDRGATRHELATAMRLPLQSICSVALSLVRLGLATERGKRSTPNGAKAAVLVAENAAEEALRDE